MTQLEPLDDNHDEPWELLFSSDRAYRIEILRGLLEEEEIVCVVMNKQDSSYVTIGEIDILVKRSELLRANQIVTKFLESE